MRQEQEFHLLMVQDSRGDRTYQLSAATYSIGRDASSNGIPVSDPLASRHHAILLRMPYKGNRYVYQLIDGDLTGKKSTNGISVNHHPSSETILKTGDQITIGESVKMSYIIANMTQEEFDQFFAAESPSFHNLKKEAIDPRGTLMNLNADEEDRTILHSNLS